MTLTQPLRRSARNSGPSNIPDRDPVPDPDEVILVYPPSGRGSVNITNGDVGRLAPGDYLNDSLIEFGLKIWLDGLRETQPDLADQIHLFSSFFYKKLGSKYLSVETGYPSVRKWTSKINIFDKKYLIIPINEKYVFAIKE
ncbi:hypothetical protein PENSPDRAFT_593361 [Peniophora sp. CONT]|nr:hypothetical protein PENSPDRAFT_593361 [Peniophora sp. CONT]